MSKKGIKLTDDNSEKKSDSKDKSLLVSAMDKNATSLAVSKRLHEDEDEVKFLGLPFDIWTRIFHYAGVLCECHIAFVRVDHSHPRARVWVLGTSSKLPESSKRVFRRNKENKDLVTFAFRKVKEHTVAASKVPIANHVTHISMLAVSHMARFVTLKALLQQAAFHLELRNKMDLKGLQNTLRGLESMSPLNRDLKRLHLNLFLNNQLPLAIFDEFCAYFDKYLRGSLTHFNMECRPRHVVTAQQIADKIVDSFTGLKSCNILFDRVTDQHPEITEKFIELSDQSSFRVMSREDNGARHFRFMDLPAELRDMILWHALTFEEEVSRNKKLWKVKITRKHHFHSCCMCSMLKHQVSSVAKGVCDCSNPHSPVNSARWHKAASELTNISPVSIFLTCKYMHAVGAPIFFSQNKFAFKTSYMLDAKTRNGSRWGIPLKYIEHVRRFHIIIDIDSPDFSFFSRINDFKMNQYKVLVRYISTRFKLTTLDLSWSLKARLSIIPFYEDNYKKDIIPLFDRWEGERPVFYQRPD